MIRIWDNYSRCVNSDPQSVNESGPARRIFWELVDVPNDLSMFQKFVGVVGCDEEAHVGYQSPGEPLPIVSCTTSARIICRNL